MRDVAIAGIGTSEIARSVDRTVGALTIEACLAALADAGLGPNDVDGMATYPAGYDSVACFYVVDSLGIPRLDWFEDLSGWMPAAVTPVIAAADAVARGACETALVFRSVKRNKARPPGIGADGRVGGDMQFRAPYGDTMTSQWLAMWARRHMHTYGTTEEHLGRFAVSCRDHATRNPRAPLRDPITLDDYFSSRIVTTPFRLLDCDFPVDGAGAAVLTTLERARDLPRPPAVIKGGVFATGPRPDWDQWHDLTHMASRYAAEHLWAQSGLTPADVDVAEVYDGFSWLALCWLEDMGFCPKGEGGPFVADGNTALGGHLPTNTHGGSLSGGRLHAITHVVEAVEQVRGEAGARQVDGAEVAVVTAGGGTMAGALLIAADR
jgi:acetyl-CoA acetyltransferase